MLLLEHRYYGQSHPTPDMGVKNLAWLSSRQALADLAAFITEMRTSHNLTAPWVALGGSYPGSMAAWLRLKYPHLVAGAVSTSGPLLAKADFYEYLEVVTASLDTVPGCVAAAQEAVAAVQQLLAEDRRGWAALAQKFRLCSRLDGGNTEDVANLMEALIGNLEGVVQYNRDNRAFEGYEWGNVTIDTVCELLTDTRAEGAVDGLARVNDLTLMMEGERCLDHTYQAEVRSLQDSSWDSAAAAGGRQWTYQTCTEFGWYQSSDSPAETGWGRVIPVQLFERMCRDVFGPKFTPELLARGVAATNAEYGGRDISVESVVFVHGSIDPWHAMGIVQSDREAAPAIYIEGTAHCANMYPASQDDPAQLVAARRRIGQLVHQWIQQAS